MIEVKGTRTASKTNDPAEKYALTGDITKTRTPHVIGLFLTGAALYLKSMLGGKEAENFEDDAGQAAVADEDNQPLTKKGSLIPLEFPDQNGEFTEPVQVAETVPSQPAAFRFSAPNVVSLFAPGETPTPVFGEIDQGYFPDPDAWPEAPEPSAEGEGAGGGGAEGGEETEEEAAPEDDEELERNRAPGASRPVYLFDVIGCAAVLIAFSDLLANAADPDGDALLVSDIGVSSGTFEVVADGILFHPDEDVLGPVQVNYTVSDGEFQFRQLAHFEVQPEKIVGTDGNDALLGSLCADEILALDGDDNIDGRDGNDIIFGGAGDDHIVGGEGDETIYGGAGDDIIFGMGGNDTLSGGEGDDQIYGGDGDDVVFAGDGDDMAQGGAGRDVIFGGLGADLLAGDDGDDVIDGGAGADIIEGGMGADTLMDGGGQDIVRAGAGNDIVVAAADGDDDVFDGGDGFDALDYAAATQTLEFDLAAGTVSGAQSGTDSFSGFEEVSGGQGDDLFLMDAAVRTVSGGGGSNIFEFLSGDDGWDNSGNARGEFRILDFHPGDKVKKEKYEIFDRSDDDDDDLFGQLNGAGDDDLPQVAKVRFRYERDEGENEEKTVVEFDWDNEDGLTVYLKGHHELVVVEL